jgi:hypothetical protein
MRSSLLIRALCALVLVFGASTSWSLPHRKAPVLTSVTFLHMLESASGVSGLPHRFDLCIHPRDTWDTVVRVQERINTLLEAEMITVVGVYMRTIPIRYTGIGLRYEILQNDQGGAGVSISGAFPGSSAHKTGFFDSEITLLAINGESVNDKDPQALSNLLSAHRRGVTLTLKRHENGRLYTRFIQASKVRATTNQRCTAITRN